MGHILVIEDDADINRLLCKILEQAGYETRAAFSGTEGILRLEHELPDLILLDLMLPGMSGEEVLSRIRETYGTGIPVMILSAKTALENKIETITAGADDYLTKPFEPEEVLVRVMALLRRCGRNRQEPSADSSIFYKNLVLNPEARQVLVKKKEIPLTNYEYDILTVLLGQPDKVFTREALYEKVWKNGYYGEDNTVNVHVSNIRRKLAAADETEEYIKTVWGIGFKMA